MSQQKKNQSQPTKVIVLKPGQRSRGRKRKSKEESETGRWEPHLGNDALDAWGTAIREMKAQGVSWD